MLFRSGNSENTSYDSHNLWLLDDRLAFHKHIYSDTAVRDHKPKKKQTKSRLETDLAIYDIPSTYGDKTEFGDIATIVIFEFKRPDRNINYEEFSKQMNTQIEAVCEGKIIDKNNAHGVTTENTPIFYYYVCDLNGYNSLKSRAKREGFIETPYNSLIRLINSTYEEILTYQTLLVNSKRRNKAFFKKLGIE